MQKPQKPYLDAVKWIMQYVKATYEHGMFYKYDGDIGLLEGDFASMENYSSSNNITQIVGEKLNNNNYAIRKFCMEKILIEKGYWNLVTSDEPDPRVPKRNTTTDQQKAHKTWLEKTRKVLHWLSIYI